MKRFVTVRDISAGRCCRLSPQDLLMNYGFFDAANENHQATLLFDTTAAAARGSRNLHPTAAQLDGMEVGPFDSTMCMTCTARQQL